MLFFLVLFMSAGCFAHKVPEGIEKLDNNIIRNGSTYYVLSTHGALFLELQNSTSLTNWTDQAHTVLSQGNGPTWAEGAFDSVDINVIDEGQVRIYFSAYTGFYHALGVAFSHLISPLPAQYLTLSTYMLYNFRYDYYDPRLLLLDNDQLLLSFALKYYDQPSSLSGVFLSDDGLTIISTPVTFLQLNLHWEGNQIKNHWGFEKNGYIYILYETEGGMGVARSKTDAPLGSHSSYEIL